MTFGPFLFAAPLALVGLIALPVIWWVLRATPPMPKEADLPSLRLLDGLDPREETPARTPWWILLLRIVAAALAITGLAQPVYAPGAVTGTSEDGPLLIVVDDGWPSAGRWSELVDAATAGLDTASRDTPIHLLTTAPTARPPDPAQRLNRRDMGQRLASLEPRPWLPDRDAALQRLEESGLVPSRILWASDGMDDVSGSAFAVALTAKAPLTVFAATPRSAMAITGFSADATGGLASLARASDAGSAQVFVSALSRDGTAIATAEGNFEPGARTTGARFDIPPTALARADRFRITGGQGAGTVWLWDSAARRQRVSLVSDGEAAQPLLSDLHYVRRALEPFSVISEGSLQDLLLAEPDAIVLTDIGEIADADLEPLTRWVEAGGALIRFAGPRLAAGGDALIPTPLRRASRALGGALAWDEPQALAPFSPRSPFHGLPVPPDVRVTQQVLARPAPDLDTKTWARLEDGSPLVTAAPIGAGSVILFHITAGPDWSDLSYSGVFVEMLRRAIAAGQGRVSATGEGLYAPQLVLNGYGRLEAPSDIAAPIAAEDFSTISLSETHPPGLYEGPAGTRALNAGADYEPQPISRWPAAATLLGDAEARSFPLAGALLAIALVLVAIDLFVALASAGRLPRLQRSAAALLLSCGMSLLLIQSPATAQDDRDLSDAALSLRFGYVETGVADVDTRMREGLEGLSQVLALRTSVTPGPPDALDLEEDPLELYPLIYFAVPEGSAPLSAEAVSRLNTYMRTGGALIIDTRNGSTLGGDADFSALDTLLEGLDTPALAPVPSDHVLTRSYYLIDGFPGRYADRRLWIEAPAAGARQERRGDGVSRIFVGDADWVTAWAADDRGRAKYSVDGGKQAREIALRFGVNLVMYVLTGNYKEDQVHLPALLERLGESAPGDDTNRSNQILQDLFEDQ
ncbi:MAG: DUF4159 domain-containing protein [Pseudomonadota bacterium]